MGFYFGISEVRFVDDTVFHPPKDGITVFIGPNNSGKSVLIRELYSLASNHPGSIEASRWVASMSLQTDGTSDEFLQWLRGRGISPRQDSSSNRCFYPANPDNDASPLPEDQVAISWERRVISPIAHLLTSQQWTESRLSDHTSSHVWNSSFPPAHPVQHLWDSRRAQEELSNLVRIAFGQPIAINRYEQQINLQLGDPGIADEPPPASSKLRAAYQALPYVREQGDGFKSFINILVRTLVLPTPLIVIDEPEAFLHPPQARLLGRFLAEHPLTPCQVFVTTHSSDFLSGVLEAGHRPVSVIRIDRSSSSNSPARAKVLRPESVNEILRTPLLRYSNILSGLFNDGVVLCESEGDCQFYEASLDASREGERTRNISFLHVNGKARLADAASKLRQCGVPVAIAADLDFLNDRSLVQKSISLLGGDYEKLRAPLDTIHAEMNRFITAINAQETKRKINEIIGNPSSRSLLSQDQTDKIGDILKMNNGWKNLKIAGMSAFENEAYGAATNVVKLLAKEGLFLVPVGELERWVPSISGANKSRWLRRVFEEGHHENPSSQLIKFIQNITEYLSDPSER